jgi:hypothetical protein
MKREMSKSKPEDKSTQLLEELGKTAIELKEAEIKYVSLEKELKNMSLTLDCLRREHKNAVNKYYKSLKFYEGETTDANN